MNKFSFIIAAWAFAFFMLYTSEVSAQSTPEPVNIFVHISAVQGDNGIKTGVIKEITYDDSVPAAKGVVYEIEVKRGRFPAKLRKVGNRLQFEIQRKNAKPARLEMPKGFTLSAELSKKLGASGQVVMSGGSTMIKKPGKSMLWFEIQ